MKLDKVEVRDIGLSRPSEEGENPVYVVHVDLVVKMRDDPVGFGIKLSADIPHDPTLTYEQIAERGVMRAKEIMSSVSSAPEAEWIDLYNASLLPPKPFSLDLT